jgi:acetyl esterase/lipase
MRASARVVRDVVYVEHGHARHRLDLYLPEADPAFPMLMFVSGGGWKAGSRDWISGLGHHFAPLGFGLALVDHRLAPEVTPAQQAADLAAAFVWVRTNSAAYGGDATRVFVGGHSAGGHLVALMATDPVYFDDHGRTSTDIAGVISVSGALDPRSTFAAELCPTEHVHAGLPPFLILSSEDDLPGVGAMGERMRAVLDAVGVPVTSEVIAATNHFDVVQHPRTLLLMEQWMREVP